MEKLDIYDAVLKCSGRIRSVILFGRINDKLDAVPKMVSKCEIPKNIVAYEMDLYAWQSMADTSKTVYRTSGRLVVLLPSAAVKPYTALAVQCGIHYNRFYNANTGKGEANLVVGCSYAHNGTAFDVVPARLCISSDIGVMSDEDKRLMAEEMVYAPVMPIDLQTHFLMGYDCPLLTGETLDREIPPFYEEKNKSFTQISSNISVRNVLQLRQRMHPMMPKRATWSITTGLANYLGIVDEYKDRPVIALPLEDAELEQRSDFDSLMLGVQQATATAKTDYLSALRELQLSLVKDEEYADIAEQNINRVYNRLNDRWSVATCGAHRKETGRKCVSRMLEYLYTCAGSSAAMAELRAKQILRECKSSELLDTLFGRLPLMESGPLAELYELLRGFGAREVQIVSYLAFIFTTLDLHSSITALFESGLTALTIMRLMHEDTYWLGYCALSISLKDIDALACFMGTASDVRRVQYLRAVLSMHSNMLSLADGAMVIQKDNAPTYCGYDISKPSVQRNFDERHTLISYEACELSRELFGVEDHALPAQATKKNQYTVAATFLTNEQVLKVYIDAGLGVVFTERRKTYLIDLTLADASCFVYNRLRRKTGDSTDLRLADKNALRSGYQLEENITLEQQQAKAIDLLEHKVGALIGGPGSGKTTTLKYLVYCLKHAGVKAENILMLAPSGMAAARMSACTGHKAKTVHSALLLRNLDYKFYTPEFDASALSSISWVFIDEASMLSLPLLYQALLRLPADANILFIGDINQLPPIDAGKPFIDMLNYVAYVKLNVTKRTANGSKITQNCQTLINSKSKAIVSEGDTRLVSCTQEEFKDMICGICRSHIDPAYISPAPDPLVDDKGCVRTFYPSDIQVVTPVSKANYTWGTVQLNACLRNVFNPWVPGQSHAITYKDSFGNVTEFRTNDRVLNKQNHYGQTVFEYLDPHDKYTLVATNNDVLNGSIGHVVAIEYASAFKVFRRNKEDGSLFTDYKLLRTLGMDPKDSSELPVIMLIEYTDTSGHSFMVLYTLPYENEQDGIFTVRYSVGLADIDLAYAVTVHKMQGSQAELIICPAFGLRARGEDSFINRNMIFTMMSRAKSGLYIVGDIENSGTSPLYNCRNSEANIRRVSIFDTFYDTTG